MSTELREAAQRALETLDSFHWNGGLRIERDAIRDFIASSAATNEAAGRPVAELLRCGTPDMRGANLFSALPGIEDLEVGHHLLYVGAAPAPTASPAPAQAEGRDVALWQLIYGAMMHDGTPKTVAEFERSAQTVADMISRRAAMSAQPVAGEPVVPEPSDFGYQDEEMAAFQVAMAQAGYHRAVANASGDGWLFERDADRWVGWQLARALSTPSPVAPEPAKTERMLMNGNKPSGVVLVTTQATPAEPVAPGGVPSGYIAALSSLADEIDVEEVCGHDVATHLRAMIAASPPAPASEAPREVVLPEVQRDAERYRWLRNEAWGGHVAGKRFPHAVEFMPGLMPSAVIELAEDALDAAIDEAIAYGKQCAEAAKGWG